jgi:hypothetical protein
LIDKDGNDFVIKNYPESLKWNIGEPYEDFEVRQAPIDAEQKALINEALSSGYRLVWIGYHDCREGIITQILKMKKYGTFLPNWVQQQSAFWLMHYMDWKQPGVDYKNADKISKPRIAMLPEQVRKQIKA